jgi:hypothetical protein
MACYCVDLHVKLQPLAILALILPFHQEVSNTLTSHATEPIRVPSSCRSLLNCGLVPKAHAGPMTNYKFEMHIKISRAKTTNH